MKKALIAVITLSMSLMLAACGGTDSGEESTEPAAIEKDFEGSYSDMGEGVFYLSTPAGTSENGDVPVMTVTSGTSITQIGYYAELGESVTYIYLDGVEVDKGNMGMRQGTITLDGDSIGEGTHIVEAVQYADGDTSGEVVLYKKAQFEIAN